MSKILVIDLGTTYFKFALFDRHGRLCALTRRVTPTQPAPEGRVEIPVEAFSETLSQGLSDLASQAGGLNDTEAVSFATQTNSFLLLDDADRPLTPIILWPDSRAAELEPEIARRTSKLPLASTTGVPGLNPYFMLSKLLWLRVHEPSVWVKACRACLISDYLTLLLSGWHVTEVGAAALTGLVDVHACDWWGEMAARWELDPRLLPQLVRAGTDLGCVSSLAVSRFGLPPSCRFVVGCLDQYAGAIGAGAVVPGAICETTGTVLATVRCSDHFIATHDPSLFQGPAYRPGDFWQMAFGDVSARYLHWYRDQLPDRPEFDSLVSLAAEIEPGAGGLRLTTDAQLTTVDGVFRGLSPRHTRGHIVRCILESVAWALRDQVQVVSPNELPEEIRSVGGASRGTLWLQIKADIVGVPVRATQCPEPTSLGAAILAESALANEPVPAVAARLVQLGPRFNPDPHLHQRYVELRQEGR